MADNKPNITIHITGANPQIYPTAATVVNYFGDNYFSNGATQYGDINFNK